MIKRYDFMDTTDAINTNMTGVILESEEGAYVLYSDHKRLLDAAHKALESQDDKTLEQHRTEFELHYCDHFSAATDKKIVAGDFVAMREGDDYGDRSYLNGMWEGWQAARGLKP